MKTASEMRKLTKTPVSRMMSVLEEKIVEAAEAGKVHVKVCISDENCSQETARAVVVEMCSLGYGCGTRHVTDHRDGNYTEFSIDWKGGAGNDGQ